VNVQCRADGQATRAEITYDLTALRPTAQAGLRRFADGYDNFLKEWERLIETERQLRATTVCTSPGRQPAHHAPQRTPRNLSSPGVPPLVKPDREPSRSSSQRRPDLGAQIARPRPHRTRGG
jgi:hypothetical protein